MTNNEISTSAASTTPAVKPMGKTRLIKGMIADSSGHSDFSDSPEAAVEVIKENVQKHNKWVFLNNEPVFPQTDADFADIRNRMENGEVDEFLITARLQGGEVKVVRTTGAVINSLGSRRSTPQLAFTFDGERDTVKLVMTGRESMVEKLSAHKQDIIAALNEAL